MEDLKNKKLLVIVESPSKCAHIKKYLQAAGYKNTQVIASVGHIMKLADDRYSYKNSGVYVDKEFDLNLKIANDKVKVISTLKEGIKWADKVFLMSDPDREGWVIAWSLIKFLKLPMAKYMRAVTHEITPKAVVYAIEHPIPMDNNIVDAGLARMTIDKMIGYGLSPIAKNYLGCKSVGRCQSVGLKLVADREKEIQNFIPETYFDLYLNFVKNGTAFRARYVGTDKEKIEHLRNKVEVSAIEAQCSDSFIVKDISKREKFESPKPPFCTSSLQQECANKFGLRVKDTMSIIQKLFENGFITYIRTDSTEFSEEFKSVLKTFINSKYDNKFTLPRTAKKTGVEQDGHECIRVTDLNLTPETCQTRISNDLQAKVYQLIWQRTVASALPNAKISETTYNIYNDIHKFILKSDEMLDLGYKTVYSYVDGVEADNPVNETFVEGEKLSDCNLETISKTTTPPSRYTESALVKELERNGCGRPSTFATIVETVLSESRGYATLENKKIVPTERGLQLAAYLDRAFSNIINLDYSKQLEESLDAISAGAVAKVDFLTTFHTMLETAIENNPEKGVSAEKNLGTCPNCGSDLVLKRSRFGKLFKACPGYPNCRYTEMYQ